MTDLFSCDGPLTAEDMKRKHKTQARGYAWRPGTGPAGETCGSCRHLYANRMSKTYYKCGLMRASWTGGKGSDVLVRSPACLKWGSKA